MKAVSGVLAGLILVAFIVGCAPALRAPSKFTETNMKTESPVAGVAPATIPAVLDPGFQKGIDYTAWNAGEYRSPGSDRTLQQLRDLGVTWIGLVVTGYQDTASSTAIRWDLPRTPSDADLVHAIDRAHRLGMHVMLKPHVDLRESAHWRGDIGKFFDSEDQYRAWFASYRAAMDHYADLARAHGVEELCVGTELQGLSGREDDWRGIIREVRARYKGPLTYASNHGEEKTVRWWDAVDLIGVDAYYALTDRSDPSVAQLARAWQDREYVSLLEGLSERYHKPVLFTEVGYRSIPRAAVAPWEYQQSATPDQRAQANAYQALLESFLGRPWFAGLYWWNVTTNPGQGGANDTDYTPLGKLAEGILKRYYQR